MNNTELYDKIAKDSERVTVTLINEHNESHLAGELTTLIKNKKDFKVRWDLDGPLSNVRPFTYAIVRRGDTVINIKSIKPLDNQAVGTELELTYSI